MKTRKLLSITALLILALTFIIYFINYSFGNEPICLTLAFDHDVFSSFESVSGKITLQNTSSKMVLVNGRLALAPAPWPAQFVEGILLITNESGQVVTLGSHGKIDIDIPREEFFIVLSPGQIIEKEFTLKGVGFSSSNFIDNRLYTAIVIYQNAMEATQTIGGINFKAWKGEVKSNTTTFKISP